jgi:hypothetical protein
MCASFPRLLNYLLCLMYPAYRPQMNKSGVLLSFRRELLFPVFCGVRGLLGSPGGPKAQLPKSLSTLRPVYRENFLGFVGFLPSTRQHPRKMAPSKVPIPDRAKLPPEIVTIPRAIEGSFGSGG